MTLLRYSKGWEGSEGVGRRGWGRREMMSRRRIGSVLQVVWDGETRRNTVDVWCALHRDTVALLDTTWVWVVVKWIGVGTWLGCSTGMSVETLWMLGTGSN